MGMRRMALFIANAVFNISVFVQALLSLPTSAKQEQVMDSYAK